MAIRLELPTVLFPRLRAGWEAARMQLEAYTENVNTLSRRARHAPGSALRRASQRLATRWSLQQRAETRRMTELAAFEQKYEDLVDLLCWAAKDGVRPDHAARYAELRGWMCGNYRLVRSSLRPYWTEPNVAESADPFESLFTSEDLDGVINAPTAIEDMMVTRAALDSYREALSEHCPRK